MAVSAGLAMNRIGIRLALFAVGAIIGLVSLHYRSKAIIDRSDELLKNGQALVDTLKSVRDVPTAQAAAVKLPPIYQSLRELGKEIVERAQAADRGGGVSQSSLDTFKDQMRKYQA